VALIVRLYGVPDVPFGSVVGLKVIAALIVTAYERVPMAPMLSVARIVKLLDPALVGVPEITPVVALSASPTGNVPALRGEGREQIHPASRHGHAGVGPASSRRQVAAILTTSVTIRRAPPRVELLH
jgi:hypothetical protein